MPFLSKLAAGRGQREVIGAERVGGRLPRRATQHDMALAEGLKLKARRAAGSLAAGWRRLLKRLTTPRRCSVCGLRRTDDCGRAHCPNSETEIADRFTA